MTVYDYYQASCRRGAPDLDGVRGTLVRGEDGNCAVFSVAGAGSIDAVEYRATSCVTLVAVCEHLRMRVLGSAAETARGLDPVQVLQALPEIPANRRERAELGVRALRSAVDELLKRNSR